MLETIHLDELGDKLIEDYIKLFDNYSFKNELYGRISLHVMLGQALKNNVYYSMGARRIDPRISLFLIKPQGTGKGAGYGFCENVAVYLGLMFQHLTESTDAGLIGTKVYDEELRQNVVVPGLLQDADVVGMEEASALIDYNSEFSRKNMLYVQITMNPLEDNSCRIVKKLGDIIIDFKPHASFIFLTYPPDKLLEKLTKTGFMDRLILIFEDVTLADRLETIRIMSQRTNISTRESNAEQFENVMRRLKTVIEMYSRDKVCINISEPMENLLVQTIDEFAMKTLDASPKAREKLEHFISRLYEILKKLAIHHAVLCCRHDLRASDILYARKLYQPIWRNLIISIESLLIISPEERYRTQRIMRTALDEYEEQLKSGKFVKDKVWVRRRSMVENLKKLWDNCSWETADSNLRKMERLPKGVYVDYDKMVQYEKDKIFETSIIEGTEYVRRL